MNFLLEFGISLLFIPLGFVLGNGLWRFIRIPDNLVGQHMAESKKAWKCLRCAEEVPDDFDVCWKCEANREGRMPVLNLSGEDLEDETHKDFLNEKFRPKNCVRCHVMMTYAGRQEFHEGTMWGAFGDFAELLVNRTNLEMYVCPSCLRVEFFLSDPN